MKPTDAGAGRGIYNSLVRRPISHLTDRAGLGRLEPTLPALLLASVFAWQGVDAASDSLYEYTINSNIEENKFKFDELVDYDFRFHVIKQRWQNGEINDQEKRSQAYNLKLALDRYYSYRESHPDVESVSLEEQAKFLPLFGHLTKVIEQGVHPADGFIVPPESQGPLRPEQLRTLFAINHDLLIDYVRVLEILNTDSLEGATPFTREIVDLWHRKEISKMEAQRALQEDSFWRHRFLEWKTIGVIRLNVDKGRPLLLRDLESEIIDELLEAGSK